MLLRTALVLRMQNNLANHTSIRHQLLRFCIVGGVAALIHFSTVLTLVHFCQWHPLVANILAFCIAFVASFTGQYHWTFSNTTRQWHESLPRFFSLSATSFLINEGLYWALLHYTSLDYRIALVITLGTVAIITFTLSKWWAFHTKCSPC